jgi:2TM domain-containing protein
MHESDEWREVDEALTPNGEDPARAQAVERIKRKRRFHSELVVTGIGVVILVAIWATSEYHNAGGWPTQGFSQSSGIHDVWNYWIIYPLIAVVLIVGARAWSVYGHKPISESEITREMERQSGRR